MKNGAEKRRRRRRYARSTPVGRLQRGIERALKTLKLAEGRLVSWAEGGQDGSRVRGILDEVLRGRVSLEKAAADAAKLAGSGWVPPRRSSAVKFVVGEAVVVAPKYKDKYLPVYGDKVLTDLRVTKVLLSGKIAVQHGRGKMQPIIMPKSHLRRAPGPNGTRPAHPAREERGAEERGA